MVAPSRWRAARPWVLAAFVLVTALTVRAAYWGEVRGTALDRWHLWTETDMATYLEQARRIAEEDVWAREPYHPYHGWQKIAPPEKWLEWYGPHAFHQAPAYSYVLAALGPSEPETLRTVKVAQLALGAGTALLVFLLALHVGGLLAAGVAGLAAALYGPLLYLEPHLLREGPAIFGLLAVLYATIRCVDARARRGARWWAAVAAIGAACGLFATFHEMGAVLNLVVALALAGSLAREGWKAVGAGLALFAAAYVAGFAPLLYRNVAVGAAPFAVSCRTAVNFAEANVIDAPRGGAIFAPPTPKAVAILDEASGDFGRAVLGVWRSYEGDLARLFANWWQRFRVIWQKWEAPDNTNYYFYRTVTHGPGPTARFSLRLPPGLRRRPRATRNRHTQPKKKEHPRPHQTRPTPAHVHHPHQHVAPLPLRPHNPRALPRRHHRLPEPRPHRRPLPPLPRTVLPRLHGNLRRPPDPLPTPPQAHPHPPPERTSPRRLVVDDHRHPPHQPPHPPPLRLPNRHHPSPRHRRRPRSHPLRRKRRPPRTPIPPPPRTHRQPPRIPRPPHRSRHPLPQSPHHQPPHPLHPRRPPPHHPTPLTPPWPPAHSALPSPSPAGVAQLVERQLPKLNVASSSLVARSM